MNPFILGTLGSILLMIPLYTSGANIISRSNLFNGNSYEFGLSFEELDKSPSWNLQEDFPPLSPKKAASIAQNYLFKLTENRIDWGLSTITLHNYSGRDKWVYKLEFVENIKIAGLYNGPVQTFEVIVYMSGKIVPPMVKAKK